MTYVPIRTSETVVVQIPATIGLYLNGVLQQSLSVELTAPTPQSQGAGQVRVQGQMPTALWTQGARSISVADYTTTHELAVLGQIPVITFTRELSRSDTTHTTESVHVVVT